MSTENISTPREPWMGRETRVPHQVTDAFVNNEITALQFCILVMLHRRADWTTGIFRSFSAEQVVFDLGDSGLIPQGKQKVREEYVRREAMRLLRKHGWYTRDYQEGDHRPYDLTLSNYVTCNYFTSEKSVLKASCTLINAPDGNKGEERILNVCTVTPCTERRTKRKGEVRASSKEKTVSDADRLSSAFGASDGLTTPHTPSKAVSLPSASVSGNPLPQPEPSSAVRDPSSDGDAWGGEKPSQRHNPDDGEQLRKGLATISAAKLKSTRAVPKRWREKFELMVTAYPVQTILQDFSAWCDEPHEPFTRLPVIEYYCVMDSRLSPPSTAVKPVAEDPRVKQILSACYEITGVMPSPKSVTALLVDARPEEIISAMMEYNLTLTDKGRRAGIQRFFEGDGAEVVIYTRRNRFAVQDAQKQSADARALQRQEETAKRAADAERANQEKIAKKAADDAAKHRRDAEAAEQQAAYEKAFKEQSAANAEIQRLGREQDEKIRNEFQAKQDDLSITWTELCAWCDAHPLSNGVSLFKSERARDTSWEYRQALKARIKSEQSALIGEKS